jgi:hypothetical protein
LGSISAGAPYFKTEPLNTGISWQVKLGYNPASTSTNFAHGDKCDVTLTVEGWQENMTKATAGYRDAYSVTIPVVAQMVVLNEVLAKPTPGEDEFIELFNHSAYPVDVAGFNITEKTAGGATIDHIIRSVSLGSTDMVAYDGSGSTVIPAHGYLALRYSGNTSYLNDGGDTITLLDTDNITLDAYTFGEAVANKSDARIPDGSGPWIDPVPTPNEPNAITAGEIVEVLPEVPLTEVLGEEIIVVDNEIASGTEPLLTPLIEINEEAGETEGGADEQVVEEEGEIEESTSAGQSPLETETENSFESEPADEEVVDEVKEEIKTEEPEAEEPVKEEEDEEVIEEPII